MFWHDFYPKLKILNFKPSGKREAPDGVLVVFLKKLRQKASNEAVFRV